VTGTEPEKWFIERSPVAFVRRAFTNNALMKSRGLINYGSAAVLATSPGNPRQ
jgi:hypothetical protein